MSQKLIVIQLEKLLNFNAVMPLVVEFVGRHVQANEILTLDYFKLEEIERKKLALAMSKVAPILQPQALDLITKVDAIENSFVLIAHSMRLIFAVNYLSQFNLTRDFLSPLSEVSRYGRDFEIVDLSSCEFIKEMIEKLDRPLLEEEKEKPTTASKEVKVVGEVKAVKKTRKSSSK